MICWLITKLIFKSKVIVNLNCKQRENIVESIANNFRNRFINKSGLISRPYPPDERSIINNFDDIVPFLDYFGYFEIFFSQIDILTLDSYEEVAPCSEINHIDGQVDFAISIRRLGEITNNSHLKSYSFKLVEKNLKMHRSDMGFYTHIYQNGKNKNLPKNTIYPKYNVLLLKGLVHLEEKNAEIYNNEYLFDLFKDR